MVRRTTIEPKHTGQLPEDLPCANVTFQKRSHGPPNPSVLPTIFDECQTTRDKAQILYLYLVADDSLVRYVVHEYMARLTDGNTDSLDFSNETLVDILTHLEYSDGGSFDYADSTTERWCEGFSISNA